MLQYRQQNVALVSAPEEAEFQISYAERWLAPGLEVRVGEPAVVVLSDSPYERVDPVRFATVTAAERSRTGLDLTVSVGPWPVVEDDAALIAPLRTHPTKPPFFAWRGPAAGLRRPRSDHEAREAWRRAIERLRGNTFYAESSFARVVRVLDPHGHELRGDAGRQLRLGEVATAVVEVHTPGSDDPGAGDAPMLSVLVESDPPGTVAGGVENERADRDGHLFVPVRPLTGGAHAVELSFVPDPLLSTRLRFTIDADADPRATAAEATAAIEPGPREIAREVVGDSALVQALVERLRRLPVWDDDPAQWLTLLQDHVLPLAPDDPRVRSAVAEAAYEIGAHETVIALLDDPSRFRTGDALRRLVAGLRYGMPTDVRALLREIDFDVDRNVAGLADQLPQMPDGAIRQIAEAVLDGVAGEEVLDRLLPPVFQRLRDDLALRVARECAPADPAGWLDRALDRWPDPHRVPDEVLIEILSWDVDDDVTAPLAPYVLEAVEHHVEHGDVDRVIELDQRARSLLPRAEQVRVRTATARMLHEAFSGDAGDAGDAADDPARGLLLAAATEAAGLGDPDLAVEVASALRGRWPEGDDDVIDTAVDRLRGVLADLADFQEWRDHRDHAAALVLRPVLEGKVVHLVGGDPVPGAEGLADDLGLRKLISHEPGDLDWAPGIDPDRDVVILLWNRAGRHAATNLDAAGVTYVRAEPTRSRILDALARWSGSAGPPTVD